MIDTARLSQDIRAWAADVGFQQMGIASIDLAEDEAHLLRWLNLGYHGEMGYMARHQNMRSRPAELVPGTLSVISLRMNYLHAEAQPILGLLQQTEHAAISRYALGRDYHKLIRKRLQQLATRIEVQIGEFGYRVFVDSAPVLERALARNAGMGWIGKHTNLIHPRAGSWFFLGEIYTDLPLTTDAERIDDHCGTCARCIEACPTGAIVAPYQVDARLCISYLTIELKGHIPESLRPLIGNRIFGCDDCQAVCPWNRFAQPTHEADFTPRKGLDGPPLVELFAWSEAEWSQRTQGSPLRRPGYLGWLRNIAVALGNGPVSDISISALRARADHPSTLVREHVAWALKQLGDS